MTVLDRVELCLYVAQIRPCPALQGQLLALRGFQPKGIVMRAVQRQATDASGIPQLAAYQRSFHHAMRATAAGTAKTRRKIGASSTTE